GRGLEHDAVVGDELVHPVERLPRAQAFHDQDLDAEGDVAVQHPLLGHERELPLLPAEEVQDCVVALQPARGRVHHRPLLQADEGLAPRRARGEEAGLPGGREEPEDVADRDVAQVPDEGHGRPYAIMDHGNVMSAILLAIVLAHPPGSDARLAESLVRRIEERQGKAADLTARFTQSYRSGAIGREVVERGVLRLKRPGRMLWEYKDPEKKTFVSDGSHFYFYVPADKQVIVRDQDQEQGVAALLLAAKGRVLDQFEAALDAAPGEGLFRLRLTPKKTDPELERVLVDLDAAGLVRAIEVDDAQGNRSLFRFYDVRENVGLPDRLFRFEVPPGVEVIRG